MAILVFERCDGPGYTGSPERFGAVGDSLFCVYGVYRDVECIYCSHFPRYRISLLAVWLRLHSRTGKSCLFMPSQKVEVPFQINSL